MLKEIKIAHEVLKCSWLEAIQFVLELHRKPIILADDEEEEEEECGNK